MRRGLILAAALALGALGAPAAAQQDRAQTLADIRQELSVLWVEIQRLGRELNTTGAATGAGTAGAPLQRMDAIEAELRRLTALTEDLQLRIDAILRDGTNRIGDLEFRLCELEPQCDIASLGDTPRLGGIEPNAGAGALPVLPPAGGDPAGGPNLAVAERDDFERARAAFEAGDYAGAAERFAAFTDTYPGGPLSGEAHFLRGEAEAQQGAWTRAARAYLDSFSADPDGARAPAALARLGAALGRIGQVEEACLTLGEVGARYPGTPAVAEAEAERARLGCS